jgi:hypothetical protein
MKIELLYFADCPHWKPTLSLVESVVAELKVSADIALREVLTEADALTHRFLGSPSVRIDGHDLEAARDSSLEFGLTCRVYQDGPAFSGTPSREAVTRRLRELSHAV